MNKAKTKTEIGVIVSVMERQVVVETRDSGKRHKINRSEFPTQPVVDRWVEFYVAEEPNGRKSNASFVAYRSPHD